MAQRPKRVTSADVARLAGVSRTTVSYVINDVPTAQIPEETRARIRGAIAELGYHPHQAARMLRRQSSHIIGVVIPEVVNPHHQDTYAGVEAFVRRHGYNVFPFITNFDAREEKRSLDWLEEQRFDALILSVGKGGDSLFDRARALTAAGYVVTGLGRSVVGTDAVAFEQDVGERQVLAHLAALGHRRIGYIYGVADQQVHGRRLEACMEEQRELGLPVVDAWIRRCGPRTEDGYRATQVLLAACEGGERPTALIVVNDLLATAVLSALFGAGIAVPGQMSVASFDNTWMAAYAVPPLTSVDCEARMMGESAAQLTLERLAAPEHPPVQLTTRVSLVVRASTGPAPK